MDQFFDFINEMLDKLKEFIEKIFGIVDELSNMNAEETTTEGEATV